MRAEWLCRELLTSPLYYALCTTEAMFFAELKRLKIPERRWPDFLASRQANATTHFFEQPEGKGACAIVCVGDVGGFDREQVYALLVHEAVHIWQEAKRLIGEKLPGDESEAYAIQRYSQALMFEYKRQTTEKPKKRK